MNKVVLFFSLLITAHIGDAQDSDNPDVAVAREYMFKGYDFLMSGQLDSCQYYYEKAAELYEQEEVWVKYFYCLNGLAKVFLTKGDYKKSMEMSDKVILMSQAKMGEDNNAEANALKNKSIVNYERRDFVKSLSLIERALVIRQKNTIVEDGEICGLYNMIGLINKDLGAYNLSVEYLIKALDLSLVLGEEGTYNVSHVYNNLGIVYGLKKDYELALNSHKKALKIRRKLFGDKHNQVGASYLNIALINTSMLNFDSALLMNRKAYKIFDHSLGKTHTYTIMTLNNIADVYEELGENALALDYYLKVINLEESKEDENSQSIYQVYHAIADVYFNLNDFEKALHFYQKSLIENVVEFKDTNIESNPNIESAQNAFRLMMTLRSKAHAFYEFGKKEKKLKYLQSAYSSYISCDQVITHIKHANINEKDKLEIGAKYAKTYERAIAVSLELFDSTQNEEYLERAFYFTEKNKGGVLLESLSRLAAKELQLIPEDLVIRESQIKSEKASLNTLMMQEVSNNDSVAIKECKRALFKNSRSLDSLRSIFETNYPNYYELKYKGDIISVRDVQAQLAEHEAVMEYFVGDSVLYLFTLTHETINVSRIENKEEIYSNIDRIREVLKRWNASDQSDQSFVEFTESSEGLYASLLKESIELHLTNEKLEKLVIIPDGKLAYLPFELLLMGDSDATIGNFSALNYLLAQYEISYAFSTSLKYDDRKTDLTNQARKNFLGYAPQYSKPSNYLTQLPTLDKFRSTLSYLEWNEEEVKIAAEYMAGNYRLSSEATESRFKEEVSDYRVVHLAMHAVIDDKKPMQSKLVFNLSENDSLNDGYLHTHELFNMEMNPELVVLSACNTGYGQIQKGEGINSLAYAFAYAGCPSIMMSQWPIDDKSTSQLMMSFYEHLSEGMSKSAALRKAKLKFLEDPSSRFSNPIYWAGIVLIGDTDHIDLSTSISGGLLGSIFLLVVLFGGLLWFVFVRRRPM